MHAHTPESGAQLQESLFERLAALLRRECARLCRRRINAHPRRTPRQKLYNKVALQCHYRGIAWKETRFGTMHRQRIIASAMKYVAGTVARSNYATANFCLLPNQRRNMMFRTYLSGLSKIKKGCGSCQWKKSFSKYFIVSGSFLFNLFGPKEEKDDLEDLRTTIKRSILLIQKQEFRKAEQMLHIALRQAQTLQHYDGITYVYDVMANLAYDTNDFKKAETLFKSVLKRLVAKGVAENDLAVIHISLKIADIYANLNDAQKAENGYKFCLQHLREHVDKDSDNEDALQLLGLNLEKYASMLFSQYRYTTALAYFTQALDVCVKLNGEEHEQTVVLLNDLGSVSFMLQKHDQAIDFLTKAVELGKKLPDMVDLGFIHVNLGNVLIAKGMYDEAEKSCGEGERLAKSRNDSESAVEAKKCLEMIEQLTAAAKTKATA